MISLDLRRIVPVTCVWCLGLCKHLVNIPEDFEQNVQFLGEEKQNHL